MSGRGRPLRRPWAGPFGLYRPGTTTLHRARPGAKLVGLAAFSVVVVLAPNGGGAWARAAVVALALLACVVAVRVRVPGRAARGAVGLALVVGLGRAWTGTPVAALLAGLATLGLVLAGAVLTTTTPAGAMLDALAAAARPLRRFGVRPDRAALAAVLMVRSVPALADAMDATREAARARGCDRDPRTWLAPAAVRAVARAHATGEALAARGLGEGEQALPGARA